MTIIVIKLDNILIHFFVFVLYKKKILLKINKNYINSNLLNNK